MAILLAMTGAEEKAVSRMGEMGLLRPKSGVDGGLELNLLRWPLCLLGWGYKVRKEIATVAD